MAVKLNVEIVNLPKLVKKLGPTLVKPEIDKAIGETAEDAAPVLKTLVGVHTGALKSSISTTKVSDRAGARSKSVGTALSGFSSAYVRGNWYGRFPDRGTRYIKRRGWSVKARKQVKPQADRNLQAAGKRIQSKWSK